MTDRPHLTLATLAAQIDPDRPVLIAGPTASGKSALAMEIAARQGGRIVNADASQVYACWRILTARPTAQEEAETPHALYGHIAPSAQYSVGHWLREVAPLLHQAPRPIIVGGTGLYFQALTQGLAHIPNTPPEVRRSADALPLDRLLSDLDAETRNRIDGNNRARVQRAWEVLEATGVGLAQWQARTEPPLLPLPRAQVIVVDAPKDWLSPRIARRFDLMLQNGALDEVRAVLPSYDSGLPAHRAIGAPELVAHLRGDMTLADARDRAIVATRQFAKRQRTWFRGRMHDWLQFRSGT